MGKAGDQQEVGSPVSSGLLSSSASWIRQPGLWAPPPGSPLPSVALNQLSAPVSTGILSSPQHPAEDPKPQGCPRATSGGPRAMWAVAGDGARPQGCGVMSGLSENGKQWAVRVPQPMAGKSYNSSLTHPYVSGVTSRALRSTVIPVSGTRKAWTHRPHHHGSSQAILAQALSPRLVILPTSSSSPGSNPLLPGRPECPF